MDRRTSKRTHPKNLCKISITFLRIIHQDPFQLLALTTPSIIIKCNHNPEKKRKIAENHKRERKGRKFNSLKKFLPIFIFTRKAVFRKTFTKFNKFENRCHLFFAEIPIFFTRDSFCRDKVFPFIVVDDGKLGNKFKCNYPFSSKKLILRKQLSNDNSDRF